VQLAKEDEMLQALREGFAAEGVVTGSRRVSVSVDAQRLLEVCRWLREHDFAHLSAISTVDWLEQGVFELSYHVWSYQDRLLVSLKVQVDRTHPVVSSVVPVWDGSAGIHERELRELFGIAFDGNPDLAPLFLEDWQGPPPFRKDFDWREYVREHFYDRENEREHVYYD
jgi:NADH-quinone oxidoreductase subunit C